VSLVFVADYWIAILLGVAVLMFGIWTFQARREAETAKDTGRLVGEKARRTTGGLAGFLSALTIGVVGGLYEAGVALGDVGELLGEIVANSPELVAGIVTGGLGLLGFTGTITPIEYVGLALVVLGGGAIVAARQGASS